MSDKRRGRRKQLDASHQRNWLTGRHAVIEMLKAGIWPFTRLCATAEIQTELADILPRHDKHSQKFAGIEHVTADRLTELCGSRHHQGLAAQMGPFPYRTLQQLSQILNEDGQSPQRTALVVICDLIQDGHNLGAMLRSCDAMAVTAVILGTREQTGVTPQVARASAGAVNHVPIVRVEQLQEAVTALRDCGFQILAASEKSSTPAWNVDASRPCGFIIGSEPRGVAASLLATCDQQIAIPMLGRVDSLNAAVAAGILLYEFRRGGH